MTVLVAYATHSGATTTLAETIVATLTEAGTPAELVDVTTEPDPSAYDAVVLGSGIRIESIEKTAAQWARDHRAALLERPLAFFTCSGSAADPAKGGRQKATDAFLDDIGFSPAAVKNFPGWVLMDRIPLHERVLLKSMRTPTGDFRDLDAVAEWAREIRPLLEACAEGASDGIVHGKAWTTATPAARQRGLGGRPAVAEPPALRRAVRGYVRTSGRALGIVVVDDPTHQREKLNTFGLREHLEHVAFSAPRLEGDRLGDLAAGVRDRYTVPAAVDRRRTAFDKCALLETIEQFDDIALVEFEAMCQFLLGAGAELVERRQDRVLRKREVMGCKRCLHRGSPDLSQLTGEIGRQGQQGFRARKIGRATCRETE